MAFIKKSGSGWRAQVATLGVRESKVFSTKAEAALGRRCARPKSDLARPQASRQAVPWVRLSGATRRKCPCIRMATGGRCCV